MLARPSANGPLSISPSSPSPPAPAPLLVPSARRPWLVVPIPPDESDWASGKSHAPSTQSSRRLAPACPETADDPRHSSKSLPTVSTIHHVIHRPRIFHSEFACHGPKTALPTPIREYQEPTRLQAELRRFITRRGDATSDAAKVLAVVQRGLDWVPAFGTIAPFKSASRCFGPCNL